MGRSKRQLVGKWTNDDGATVWVYKAGGSYWISYGNNEHLCHPSVRSLNDTSREALIVFHVNVPNYEAIR